MPSKIKVKCASCGSTDTRLFLIDQVRMCFDCNTCMAITERRGAIRPDRAITDPGHKCYSDFVAINTREGDRVRA